MNDYLAMLQGGITRASFARMTLRRLRYIGNTHGMFSGNNLPRELPE